MDKMLKLALAIAMLLAGGGVFYHYVIFLPAVERQAAAQAEQEKAKVAQEEAAWDGEGGLLQAPSRVGVVHPAV